MNAQVNRVIEGAFALDNLHFLSGQDAPAPKHGRPRVERELAFAESDSTYFSRRAREERASAEVAVNDMTRALHLELADRYANVSAAIREVEERIG